MASLGGRGWRWFTGWALRARIDSLGPGAKKNHMRAGSQARRITARRLLALHKAASRCACSMLVDALLSLNTALRSHTSAAPSTSTSTTHDEPTPPSPPLCSCTCTTPTELAASCAEHYYPYECGHRRSASRRLKLLPVDSALPSEDWATTASVLQHLIIAATAIVLVDRCSAWEIARCAKVMQSENNLTEETAETRNQKPHKLQYFHASTVALPAHYAANMIRSNMQFCSALLHHSSPSASLVYGR